MHYKILIINNNNNNNNNNNGIFEKENLKDYVTHSLWGACFFSRGIVSKRNEKLKKSISELKANIVNNRKLKLSFDQYEEVVKVFESVFEKFIETELTEVTIREVVREYSSYLNIDEEYFPVDCVEVAIQRTTHKYKNMIRSMNKKQILVEEDLTKEKIIELSKLINYWIKKNVHE